MAGGSSRVVWTATRRSSSSDVRISLAILARRRDSLSTSDDTVDGPAAEVASEEVGVGAAAAVVETGELDESDDEDELEVELDDGDEYGATTGNMAGAVVANGLSLVGCGSDVVVGVNRKGLILLELELERVRAYGDGDGDVIGEPASDDKADSDSDDRSCRLTRGAMVPGRELGWCGRAGGRGGGGGRRQWRRSIPEYG